MENLVLIPVSELKELLSEAVENKIKEFLFTSNITKVTHPEQYATRAEVAKRLRISLPTLNQYTKAGLVTGYRIGNRVLYKQNEIEAILIQISAGKYKRKGAIK